MRYTLTTSSLMDAIEKNDIQEAIKWCWNGHIVGQSHLLAAMEKDNLILFRILFKSQLMLLEELGFTKLDLLENEVASFLHLSKKHNKSTIYNYLKERYGKYFV